jgi:hypothetical protein
MNSEDSNKGLMGAMIDHQTGATISMNGSLIDMKRDVMRGVMRIDGSELQTIKRCNSWKTDLSRWKI